MEMQEEDAGVVGSWFSESSDLQTEILARLPEEFVYRYRLISKQWNAFLSSNYFLTKWAEAPPNGRQPRLVVCNSNPEMPCVGFCFYTRTWINPYFTLSFLQADWRQQAQAHIDRVQSVAGFILVTRSAGFNTISIKLCNPYTQAFVDIFVPHRTRVYGECIVVKESSNQKSNTAYKVVALRDNSSVQIYEPSQQDWNIAGYFPDDYKMDLNINLNLNLKVNLNANPSLVYCNGSFYGHCQRRADQVEGIACFSIPPLDVAPKPIPVLFAPFPEIVRNYNLHPWIITSGSRLLLIAQGPVDNEQETIIWEFRNGDSKSVSWKWLEIARMPSLLCKEWRNKLSAKSSKFLWHSCTGVGDHVCFTPSSSRIRKTGALSVVVYNLINNTWDFLPTCPISFLGWGSSYGEFYSTISLVPSLHKKIR